MIAPEGKIIIVPLLCLLSISMLIYLYNPINIIKGINIFLLIINIFCLYFFRDPNRIVPNIGGFLSPADGKIVKIISVEDSTIGKATQISIFLSVFNVHIQRVPLKGKVLKKIYNPGRFHAAFKDKASKDNEQTSILFESNGNMFKIKQIAGWVARRIINYMNPDELVHRGQRMGFIRFGSRVDIIVPKNFEIDVALGDIVIGNETIIGRFK